MSGMSDKISGKAKQAVGKVTDNEELRLRGEFQEAKGKAKDAADHAKKKLSDKFKHPG